MRAVSYLSSVSIALVSLSHPIVSSTSFFCSFFYILLVCQWGSMKKAKCDQLLKNTPVSVCLYILLSTFQSLCRGQLGSWPPEERAFKQVSLPLFPVQTARLAEPLLPHHAPPTLPFGNNMLTVTDLTLLIPGRFSCCPKCS